MQSDSVVQNVERLVNGFLESEPSYFLVEIKFKATNILKVFIDGDEGISIEKCVQFNRQLYKQIEEEKLFEPGNFSFEVSSPGIDKPLKLHRQFTKNIGREIEIIFNDDSVKTGKLLEVSKDDLMLEEITGKGKKQQIMQLVIPFSNIKTATVQIKF